MIKYKRYSLTEVFDGTHFYYQIWDKIELCYTSINGLTLKEKMYVNDSDEYSTLTMMSVLNFEHDMYMNLLLEDSVIYEIE